MDVAAEAAALAGAGEAAAPFSGSELRLLGEIVRDAYKRQGPRSPLSPSDPSASGRAAGPPGPGGELLLLTVLRSYAAVLARHGLDASQDTFFYKTILELSLRPETDWWHRLDAEAKRRSELMSGTPLLQDKARRGGRGSVASGPSAQPWLHSPAAPPGVHGPATRSRSASGAGSSADAAGASPHPARAPHAAAGLHATERLLLSHLEAASLRDTGTSMTPLPGDEAEGQAPESLAASVAAGRPPRPPAGSGPTRGVAASAPNSHHHHHHQDRHADSDAFTPGRAAGSAGHDWAADWQRSGTDPSSAAMSTPGASLQPPALPASRHDADDHADPRLTPSRGPSGAVSLSDPRNYPEIRVASRAFRAWRRAAARGREARLAAERLVQQRFDSYFQVQRARRTRAVFDAWADAAAENTLARRRVARALMFWQNRTVARAFEAWHGAAASRARPSLEAPAQVRTLLRWIAVSLPDKGERWMATRLKDVLGVGGDRDGAESGSEDSETGGASSMAGPQPGRAASVLRGGGSIAASRAGSVRGGGGGRSLPVARGPGSASPWAALGLDPEAARRVEHLRCSVLRRIMPLPHRLPLLQQATAVLDSHTLVSVWAAWKRDAQRTAMARRHARRTALGRAFAHMRARTEVSRTIKERFAEAVGFADAGLKARMLRKWARATLLGRSDKELRSRLAKRTTARVLASWHRAYVVRHAARISFGRMISLRFFRRWAVVAHEQHVLKRVTAAWTSRRAAAALRSWQAGMAAARERDAFLATKVATLRRRSVFRRWTTALEQQRKIRRCIVMLRWRTGARVFAAWKGETEGARRLRKLEATQEARRNKFAAVRALRAWKVAYARRVGSRRITARWTMRTATQAMTSWKAFTAAQRAHKQGIAQAVARMRNLRLASAFAGFAARVEEHRQARLAMQRALAFITQRSKASAFASWADFAADSKRAREAGERAVRRWRNASLLRALKHWRESAAQARHSRHLAARFLAVWNNAAAAACFRSWTAYTRQALEEKALILRCVKRIQSARSGAALRTWVAWARARAERRRRLRIVVARIRNSTLVTVWNAWRSDARESKNLRNRTAALAARFRNARAYASLLRWRDVAQSRSQARRAMFRAVSAFRNQRLSGGLRAWREATAERRGMRERARRLVARWRGARQLSALQQWVHWSRSRVHRREAARVVVRRMQQANVASGLRRWVEFAERRRETRERMRGVVRRLRLAQAGMAIARWRAVCDERHRQREVLRSAAFRMLHIRTGMALRTWLDVVASRREARERLRSMARTLLHAKSAMALRTWRQTTRDRIANREQLRVVVRRMQAAGAVRALRRWRNAAHERIATKESLRRVVAAFRSGKVLRAIRRWRDATEEAAATRGRLMAVALRLRNARASRAVTHWRTIARGAAHQRSMVRVAVARFRMATAGRAFDTWRSNLSELKEQRLVLSRAAAFLRNRTAASAFRTWKFVVRDTVHQREVAHRVGARLLNWRAARGLSTWRQRVADKVARRNAARRVMVRWQNQRVVGAIATWRERAAHRRHVREVVARCMRRLRMRTAASAFASWAATAKEGARRKELADRFVRRALNARLTAALVRWHERVQAIQHNRSIMAASVRRFTMHAQGRALRRWIEVLEERKEARRNARVALQWWTGSSLRRCFAALAQNRTHGLQLRLRMHAAVARFRNAAAARAFATWRCNAQEAKRRREGMARALARWQMITIAASFSRWTAHVEARRRARLIIHRMRVARQAAAWEQWRAATAQHREAEEAAQQRAARALAFWTNGHLARVFGAWRAHTEHRRSLLDRGNAVAAMRSRRLGSRAWRGWRIACHTEALHRAALLRRLLREWRAGARMEAKDRHDVAVFDARVEAAGAGAFPLVRAAGMRWANLEAGRAFSSLALFARMRRVRQIKNLMARHHHHRAVAASAWAGWKRFVLLRREARAARHYYYERLRDRTFRNWHRVAVGQRCERERFAVLEQSAALEALRRLRQRAFVAWAGHYVRTKVARAHAAERILRADSALMRDVLLAWSRAASDERRRRAGVEAILGRSQSANLALRFRFWRDRAREAKRHRVLANSFFATSARSRALSHWRMTTRVRRWTRDSAAKVKMLRAALSSKSVGRVFAEWREYARKRAAAERLRRTLLVRNLQPAVFRAWRAQAHRSRLSKSEAVAFAARLVMGSKRRCFEALREHAAEERRIRGAMETVVRRWQQRRLTAGIARWRERAQERAERRHLLMRAVVRMRRASAVRALTRWRQWSATRAERRNVAIGFLRRLRHAKAHAAILRWQAQAQSVALNRRALARAVQRMRQAKAVQSLVRWREWSSSRRARRVAATRVVQRFRNGCLAAGLSRWREEAAARKLARQRMARAVQRMLHSGAVRALRVWKERAAEAAGQRQAAMRVVLRMRHQQTGRALRRWLDVTKQRIAHRDAVRRAVAVWRQSLVARAFATLRSGCIAQQEEQARALRRQEAVEQLLKRALGNTLQSAFGSWKTGFEWRKRVKTSLGRIVAVMRGHTAAKTFYALRDHAKEQQAERRAHHFAARLLYGKAFARMREHARVRRLARRAAARIRSLRLWRGLSEWRRFRVAKRVARMIRGRDSDRAVMAFQQWRSNAHFAKRLRVCKLRAAQRLTNGTLTHAFLRWSAAVQVRKAIQALAGRSRGQILQERFTLWKRHADRSRTLRTAADLVRTSMGAMTTRSAWGRWRKAFIATRRGRAVVLSRALSALRGNALAERAERHRGAVAAAHVLRGQYHRAFLGWAAYASRARLYRLELRREQMVRLHIARRQERARERAISSTFAVWKLRVSLAVRCRGLARRCSIAGVGRRCFAALAANRRESLARKARALEAARRGDLATQRRALASWSRAVRVIRIQRDALGRGDRSLMKRVWARWAQAAHFDADARQKAEPVVRRLAALSSSRRKAELFARWKQHVAVSVAVRDAPHRAARRLLRRWHATAGASVSARRAAARADDFHADRLTRLVFAGWRGLCFSLSARDALRAGGRDVVAEGAMFQQEPYHVDAGRRGWGGGAAGGPSSGGDLGASMSSRGTAMPAGSFAQGGQRWDPRAATLAGGLDLHGSRSGSSGGVPADPTGPSYGHPFERGPIPSRASPYASAGPRALHPLPPPPPPPPSSDQHRPALAQRRGYPPSWYAQPDGAFLPSPPVGSTRPEQPWRQGSESLASSARFAPGGAGVGLSGAGEPAYGHQEHIDERHWLAPEATGLEGYPASSRAESVSGRRRYHDRERRPSAASGGSWASPPAAAARDRLDVTEYVPQRAGRDLDEFALSGRSNPGRSPAGARPYFARRAAAMQQESSGAGRSEALARRRAAEARRRIDRARASVSPQGPPLGPDGLAAAGAVARQRFSDDSSSPGSSGGSRHRSHASPGASSGRRSPLAALGSLADGRRRGPRRQGAPSHGGSPEHLRQEAPAPASMASPGWLAPAAPMGSPADAAALAGLAEARLRRGLPAGRTGDRRPAAAGPLGRLAAAAASPAAGHTPRRLAASLLANPGEDIDLDALGRSLGMNMSGVASREGRIAAVEASMSRSAAGSGEQPGRRQGGAAARGGLRVSDLGRDRAGPSASALAAGVRNILRQ